VKDESNRIGRANCTAHEGLHSPQADQSERSSLLPSVRRLQEQIFEMDEVVHGSSRVGEVLDSSNLSGDVFEVVNLTDAALLDDLLPLTRQQITEKPPYGRIADGVLDGAASRWFPVPGNRTRGVNVGYARYDR